MLVVQVEATSTSSSDRSSNNKQWINLKLTIHRQALTIIRWNKVNPLLYLQSESETIKRKRMKKIIVLSCMMLLCSFAGMALKFALIDLE